VKVTDAVGATSMIETSVSVKYSKSEMTITGLNAEIQNIKNKRNNL
jgi:hypothetical protein